jgi:hypothetical protein
MRNRLSIGGVFDNAAAGWRRHVEVRKEKN